MIVCRLAICAERIIRDIIGGHASIIHIIDRINADAFPIVARFMCLIIYDKEGGEQNDFESFLRFRLGEVTILETPAERMEFESTVRKRQIVGVDGLVIARPGELRMEVLLDGQVAASWLVHITKAGLPQLQLNLADAKGAAELDLESTPDTAPRPPDQTDG